MNILTKGLLLIAVPVVFQLVFLGVLVKAQSDAASADWWSLHSKQVIAQAQTVEEPVLRELAEMRRAVIMEDSSARGTQAFWADLDGRVGKLIALVADREDQSARARQVDAAVKDFHAWVDDLASRIDTGSRARAEERIRDGSGKAIADRLVNAVGDFLKTEVGLDEERAVAAAKARREQRWVLLAAGAASIVAGGTAAFLFARGIGGRLAVLTANARRLADGTTLLAPVMGTDEIATLDKVLHETGHRLAEAVEKERIFKAELQKRADELGRVNEHLRQQTQENEMFIYSVSHDLRSPLVNLQGFGKELRHSCEDLGEAVAASSMSDVEKKRIATILAQDVGESLRFLQTAVMRAANIIDALLRLSRVGRVEYQMKRAEVSDIVQRVVDAMQGTIRERGAEVTVKALEPVFGDATAVEQIFGNLIGNAVNYLDPQRPGKIEVGMSQAIRAEGEGQQNRERLNVFYVKDNGMGIPKAYMGKMFTVFQRLHGNAIKGEGIGLALVRRMAERHGGRVWVESEQGEGTTFFVSLPAWDEGAPAAAPVTGPRTE